MAGKGRGLSYFMRWEVPICALVVVVPALVAAVVLWRGRFRPHAASLWVPCWRGLRPSILLAYRALAFLVTCAVFSQVLRYEGVHAFFFYTQWTFALVTLYFAVGTLVSAQNCCGNSKQVPASTEERNIFLQGNIEGSISNAPEIQTSNSVFIGSLNDDGKEEKLSIPGHLLQIIYQISAGAVLLTDVVFWCLIVPFLTDDHFRLTLLLGLIHSLNLVALLLDTAFNSMAFPLFGMAYFVLWSCAFVIFQWTLHACCVSWWPYPFLELATPWAPLWYFGIALVHIPCYGVYMLAVKLKTSLFSKIFPHAYIKPY